MSALDKKIQVYQTMLDYFRKNPDKIMAGDYKNIDIGENVKQSQQRNFLPIDSKDETQRTKAIYSFGMSIINTSRSGRIQSMPYEDLMQVIRGEISYNLFDEMSRIEASLVEQCIFKDPARRIKLPNIQNHPLFCMGELYPAARTKIAESNPNFNRDHKINSSLELKKGGFGTVYLVLKTPKNKNYQDFKYYVKKKVVIDNEENANKLKEEAKINKYLIDHHIAGCVLPFDEKITDKCVKLYMEYYPSIELGDLIEKYGCVHESDVRLIFKPVIEALKGINDINIIYRDFKPANILVGINKKTEQIEGKLIDFGIAKAVTDTTQNTSKQGTPSFMAPEVVANANYTFSCDIYSIGVSIYNSLIGRHPLPDTAKMELQYYRVNMSNIPSKRGLSIAVIDLIQKCMQYDTSRRLKTMGEVLDHPFFDPKSKESKTLAQNDIQLSTMKILDLDF
jgi:serine/threonine protein kinase